MRFREPTTTNTTLNRLAARILFVPTLAWNLLRSRVLGQWQWWTLIEKGLYLGAIPLVGDARKFSSLGITGVVNFCEESEGPVAIYAELGIEQLRLPTIDFVPPTLANIQRGIEFINQHLQRGGGVYVHCKAGRARSATLVLCYLMTSKQLTAEAAQELISRKRPQVYRWICARPVVDEFAKTLKANR